MRAEQGMNRLVSSRRGRNASVGSWAIGQVAALRSAGAYWLTLIRRLTISATAAGATLEVAATHGLDSGCTARLDARGVSSGLLDACPRPAPTIHRRRALLDQGSCARDLPGTPPAPWRRGISAASMGGTGKQQWSMGAAIQHAFSETIHAARPAAASLPWRTTPPGTQAAA